MSSFRNLLKKRFGRRSLRRPRDSGRFMPRFETLELRQMLAVTAVFAPANGVLSVYGDSADNTIEISRNAGRQHSRQRRRGEHQSAERPPLPTRR